MSEEARRATSADVARAAGVSRSTVSYVLNDNPNYSIPEATRQRVREAATSLGYTPSAAARALRRGRSDVVLCLLPDYPIGATLGGFVTDLAESFTARGLTFLVHPISSTPADLDQLWRAVTPAAIVALREFDSVELASISRLGVPVAEVVYGRVHHSLPRVVLPNEGFGAAQVEHLYARGHRRIGYAYPPDPRLDVFATARLAGVRDACDRLHLSAPKVASVELESGGALDAIATWRSGARPVTAVCAYNDEVALVVLDGMRRMGLEVPGDLAVIGVDDIPSAALSDPPLTTIRPDLTPYAVNLAAIIAGALAGSSVAAPTSAGPVDVILRQST